MHKTGCVFSREVDQVETSRMHKTGCLFFREVDQVETSRMHKTGYDGFLLFETIQWLLVV